jgi:hypothetical protein
MPLSRQEDQALTLKAGDKLELEEIPTSGAHWEFGTLPDGWSVATDEWSSGVLDDADEFGGSPGIRVLHFAAAPGAPSGSLILEHRPADPTRGPTATVRLQLEA